METGRVLVLAAPRVAAGCYWAVRFGTDDLAKVVGWVADG
jgi:hypothetical protein